MSATRDVSKVSVSSLSNEEFEVYYKDNPEILKLHDALQKTRAAAKKTDDFQARKPMLSKIQGLIIAIREAQLDHFNKLKKIDLVAISDEPRAGLLRDHPAEKAFVLSPTSPVSVPIGQAKELIKEGVAKEFKS